jgi:GMP synthase-like glutamine amidotransferase
MKPVTIFTHVACEPPGYLCTLLEREGIAWRQVCLSDGQPAPHDSHDASALVFMGGPGDVNQPTEWMRQEFEIIRQAFDEGTPMLGICLGGQLMSKALGGQVWPGDDLEVGWHQVRLSAAGRAHALFDGVTDEFPVFQWHAHHFSAPQRALSLASNDCAPCQAWVMDQHLALQFHLEMTEQIIRALLDKFAEDVSTPSNCVQARDAILDDIQARSEAVFAVADRLLVNWFRAVLPI